MKRSFVLLVGVLFYLSVTAQSDYFRQFAEIYETGDSLQLKQILQEWEKHSLPSPEFYSAWVNYYYKFGRHETYVKKEPIKVYSAKQLKSTEGLYVVGTVDTETLSAPNEAELVKKIVWNESFFQKALEYNSKGIELFPLRLDLRLEKFSLYYELEDYDKSIESLLEIGDAESKKEKPWMAAYNVQLSEDESTSMIIGVCEMVFNDLMQISHYKAIQRSEVLAEGMLKHYPDNFLLRYKVGELLMTKNPDKSMAILLPLLEEQPDNYDVMFKVALLHKDKGNKKEVKKYYKILSSCGNKFLENMAGFMLRDF